MPEHPRWAPDDQLVPAILAGSCRKISSLGDSDRSWAVAGLVRAGLTAEDIADRMGCSLRMIRTIRAQDMTQVCLYLQKESAAFADECSAAGSEIRGLRAELSRVRDDHRRVRERLDRVLDAHLAGVPLCRRCQTPMQGYNLYEHNGKRFCRECHRLRQSEYRARTRKS